MDFAKGMQPGASVYLKAVFEAPADITNPAYPAPAWNSFAHTETVKGKDQPVAEPPKAGVGIAYGNLGVDKLILDAPDGVKVGPFTIDYRCAVTTASGDVVEVTAGSETFQDTHPLRLTGIPAGAECRIWESESAGAVSDHGVSNPIVLTVTPQDDATGHQLKVIANQFPKRDLIVSKRITGDAGDEVGHGPFVVTVDCSFRGQQLPGFPQTMTFTGNQNQTITGLPAGAKCEVEETDAGGATRHDFYVISTQRATVGAKGGRTAGSTTDNTDNPAEVVVANEFATGGLLILKHLEGPGSSPAARSFTFNVSCDFNGRPAVVQRDVTLTAPTFTTTISDLPVGSVCTVTETNAGGADKPADPVGPLTIAEGSVNVVSATFTNTFSAGRLTLLKKVTGPGATSPRLKGVTFPVKVLCELGSSYVLDSTYSLTPGVLFTVPQPIPIGARCWAGETASHGASKVAADHGTQATAIAVTTAGQTIGITVTNYFSALPNTGAGGLAQLAAWALALLAVGGALLAGARVPAAPTKITV